MTREGAVEVNAATGKKKRISKRIRDADFAKTEAPPQPEQAAQPLPGGATSPPLTDTPPLPHAPGAEREQDTAAAERVLERIDGARTRKASKKAARKAQAEATAKEKSSRLQFTDEERATPELERYIRKSDKAADRLDAAKAAIPKEKKLTKERTFDEATGKGKTRLHFEEQEKPIGKNKPHNNPLSRPAQEAGIFVHNKIHSVEKDNSGVEGAHKSEELAERGAKYGARKLKQGYRSHKLKPYREAAKAEKAAFKANVNFQYHKTLHDNPQLTSNPLSRFMQKPQIKRQYVTAAKKGGAKAAACGLAGSVCGHNGRGADAVFLFGVLLFRLRAVRRLAVGCAAVQDGGRLCDRRVCRAGCGVCGLPHDEGPYLLRLPRKRGVCERL